MQEVLERIGDVEARLHRLLVSGWRAASHEAVTLRRDADGLAGRIHAVGAATTTVEVIPAIALALTACRLLRVRIPADQPPAGDWRTLGTRRKTRRPARDRLIPISRLQMLDQEVWACIRFQGSYPSGWTLVEPIPIDAVSSAAAPPASPSGGLGGLVAGLLGRRPAAEPSAQSLRAVEPRWLQAQVQGYLVWQARCPLGAAGEVDLCRLDQPEWSMPEHPGGDPFRAVRENAGGDFIRGKQRFTGYGSHQVTVERIEPDALERYVWPDPAAATAFRAGSQQAKWALVWSDRVLTVPLALLAPSRLIHLVPGNPTSPLE